jgi:hypothetical protein
MYDRLPEWMKVGEHVTDNDHEWELGNGSRVLAFPTTAGDSYSATLAIVDEADLVPDLGKLLRSVKPTIDAGGRLILLSRVDKSKPQSAFKKVYVAAKQRLNGWAHVFLPWHARPDRDEAWYEAQKADVMHRTGSLDDLHEQYPATDTEALSPRTLDKRISPAWLAQCYQERRPGNLPADAPAIPTLEVYALPWPGRRYVIGADPAEGNPTSDDSSLTVLDAETGEEAASLAGKFQPSVFASYIAAVSEWYNDASAMVERNNHGHAVILWLHDNSRVVLLIGHDQAIGWLSSSKGKALLYDAAADAFREGKTVLHSFATFTQLSSIEGATLRAPDGEHDDRADSYSLACVARQTRPRSQLIEGDLLVWPPPPESDDARRAAREAPEAPEAPVAAEAPVATRPPPGGGGVPPRGRPQRSRWEELGLPGSVRGGTDGRGGGETELQRLAREVAAAPDDRDDDLSWAGL